jgi:hypothetical protein
MSVTRPPKSLIWKDRPKSRKVSKIRTVSTIHRTTRLEPPTEDTTSNTAPQANDGDSAVAVEEEQAQPEPMIQDQSAQARRKSRRTWPYGSEMPGFGACRGTSWHDSDSEEHEERDEHDDSPPLATTSNARENPTPIARTSKRCRETEAHSGYPKYFVDEFENLGDLMTVYIRCQRVRHRYRAPLRPIPRDRARRHRGLV